MSTPLLVRCTSTSTSTSSKGTVPPPDTCQHQLEPASPHLDCADTSRTWIDTDVPIDPQSIDHLDLQQTQERTVGGKFFNNPYGTVLTTIVELGSTSTLLPDSNQSQLADTNQSQLADSNQSQLADSNQSQLADSNQSQLPTRTKVEPDAAAVKEFRRIVNGRSSGHSSEEAPAAGGNNGLERQSLEQKQLVAEKQIQDAEKLGALEQVKHNGTCLSDHGHGSDIPAAYKGPNDDDRAKLGQASTKIRSECSSPKHLFHIFPDYIQLGSVPHEKPHHVQMHSTGTRPRSNSVVAIYEGCQRPGVSEASEDTVGTRYLPVGHIPHPSSHQRPSATRSSTSSGTPRTSVDEWASGKCNSSAGEHQHKERTVDQDSYHLGDHGNTNRVNVPFRSTRHRSRSLSRPTTRTPPPQAYACQYNQRRLSASSSLENRGSSLMGTSSTHTFRSAALESLLPIAAAQGIIIPYTLTPRHDTQARSSSNRTTRFETSHSELSVLYHRGDVCRHRAAAYVAKGIEPQDTLLQMLEQVRVDGAVEIRERKDWCWRCRVEKRLDKVAGAAVPGSCCFSGADKAGAAERARLMDV